MNMPSACVYSAGDGNGKIGRQAAYVPDRCLRDGAGVMIARSDQDPARARFAGEQFQIWTSDESFDAVVDSVRLAGVLAALLDQDLTHIGIQPLGIAACAKPTLFEFRTGPLAHAHLHWRIVRK